MQTLHTMLLTVWLVNDTRQVENPIPFAGSRLTRTLSTGHLHVRYFGLLLAPWHLSADWSFNCVPLVTSLRDPRNALAAALYTLLACMAWKALRLLYATYMAPAPASCASSGSGSRGAASQAAFRASAATAPAASASPALSEGSTAAARWAIAVFFGLLAAPFLPSSNLLLYVGTFIGERLLYIPSIGFCILLARLLTAAHGMSSHTCFCCLLYASHAVQPFCCPHLCAPIVGD